MTEEQGYVKEAVVTGAGSGIGLDCAHELVRQGWRVFALDRSSPSLDAARAALSERSESFVPITCDVSSSAEVERAFAEIAAKTEKLDALICSAGILRSGALSDMAEQDFDALFAINTKGSWLSARSAIPFLEKGVASGRGPTRIVFVGSVAAIRPKVGGGAYAASKIAVTYLARVLSAEIAPKGILVNAVAPATIDTPMTKALRDKPGYKLSGVSPLGRVGVPADVTAVIQFLLSPAADYVSGAVIPIDGATSAAYIPG